MRRTNRGVRILHRTGLLTAVAVGSSLVSGCAGVQLLLGGADAFNKSVQRHNWAIATREVLAMRPSGEDPGPLPEGALESRGEPVDDGVPARWRELEGRKRHLAFLLGKAARYERAGKDERAVRAYRDVIVYMGQSDEAERRRYTQWMATRNVDVGRYAASKMVYLLRENPSIEWGGYGKIPGAWVLRFLPDGKDPGPLSSPELHRDRGDLRGWVNRGLLKHLKEKVAWAEEKEKRGRLGAACEVYVSILTGRWYSEETRRWAAAKFYYLELER